MPLTPNKETIRNWDIYKITNPSNSIYIGLSSQLSERIKRYKILGCKKQHRLYNSLLKYGWDNHDFKVIDTFISNADFAYNKERFWIRTYMSNSKNGMNLTEGGNGCHGLIMSDEAKQKISSANTGRKWPEESRKKFSISRKGINSYWPTQETIDKMSKARIGCKHNDETKLKISKTRIDKKIPSPMKGIKLSGERRKQIGLSKIGNTNSLGLKRSEETKLKISEAGKGRIPWNKGISQWSEADRKRMSISATGRTSAFKGKHHTEETKAKLSLITKNQHIINKHRLCH